MSSQAYTPGLKRKEAFVVEKTRKLPIVGEVLVKEGDKVSYDTIVARTLIAGDPYIVNVAQKLAIEQEELVEYMVKKEGDPIQKGEILAKYIGFLGLVKRYIYSPIRGTVEKISELSGQVILRSSPIPVEIKAYIPGTVVKVLSGEGVIIRTPAAFIQGIFGIGGETACNLMMVSNTADGVVKSEQITSECEGKILVGGSLINGEALRKAVKVGAKGVVIGGIKEQDFIEFLGYEIGVAITGHEELGITLILNEGFGRMNMHEKVFKLFEKFEGKLACINGATQIRAGVMRPEVIIPRYDITSDQISKLDEENFSEGLIHGTIIRLIREPYFGILGKVVSLPVNLQKLASESKVRVLEAELEDGRRVIVPRANVEIIEE